MNNLNKTMLITLGMILPLSVMASPDDDVTIRMMGANENASEAITRQIELPEAASERAKEHASEGLEAANKNRNRNGEMDRSRERDVDGDDRDHEMEREREREREESHEREMDRDDRQDIEQERRNREESVREDLDEGRAHGDDRSKSER